MRIETFALLLPLAWTASTPAPQDSGPKPRLVLETLDGSLREVDPAGFALKDPREADVWMIRPEGFEEALARPGQGPLATVVFANGDELRAQLVGGEGERLTLELFGGMTLPVDIGNLRALFFEAALGDWSWNRLEAPEEGDRIFRRAGAEVDRIDGTVESFSDEGVTFDSVLGSKTFAWGDLAGLFVEVLGDPQPPGEGAIPVVCDLRDRGGRLRGLYGGVSSRGVKLEVGGTELELEWPFVAELLIDDGSLTFLSDLPVVSEEGRGVPFNDELGMVWPHRVDASVTGGELRTDGRVFRRGIGSHAPTRITWNLDARFRTLRGSVGIDDSALYHVESARGSVVFRILVDGETSWESGLVRSGEGLLPLPRIDLEGARELVLEADPAGDFRGDRANWLRMILVR